MADNLYDYLNRFNLGQLGATGNRFLQGAANTLNRYGVGQPGGLTSLRPATGKQKLEQAWGTIPGRLHSPQGGGFGYLRGNQPNYSDAQGNMYDAVSGRLLYGAKPRTDSGSGSISGGSFGGGSPAAERAYQTEKARVAQMAAQNPDLQRYEAARKIAAAKGATPEQVQSAEDLGMQMWAKANPTLAAKVRPGQSGYEAIQGIVGPSTASALSNQQVLGVMSFDPNTVLTTTQNIQGQFRPNQQLTDQEILAAMSFDPNVAMRSAANIAYAPMSAAESAMLQEVGGPQGEYITPMDSFVPPAQKRREANQAASPDAFARILEGISLYGGG